MTISEALSWAKQVFKNANVEGAEASAEFLLRQVVNKDRVYLFAHPEHILTPKQQVIFEEWVARRAKHEPVWYITGSIEFLGLDFTVNENVLVPRPETELLVEHVVGEVKSKKLKVKSILDVGTGSGAIILSLFSSLRGADGDTAISFFASDISTEALSVAKKNAEALGFTSKINFKQGDLFEPWENQKFDLIVTNLPYIPHEDMSTLALDLVYYEPRTALDGGHEGLDIYIRFFESLAKYLSPGGKCFCEIGYDQGDKIQSLLARLMPTAKVNILGDYANIDRIVIIET